MEVAPNAPAAAKALERLTATPPTGTFVVAVPNPEEVQMLLQRFFLLRGVEIIVSIEDASAVVALWGDREGLSSKLHTLHQAGLAYADRFWAACLYAISRPMARLLQQLQARAGANSGPTDAGLSQRNS